MLTPKIKDTLTYKKYGSGEVIKREKQESLSLTW